MNRKTNLGEGSIGKLLLSLAVPTVAAQIVNLLYNVVDRIYIGNIDGIGALGLTGVGLCFPIIMVVNAFALLMGSGGAPRAAIAMGKGDNDEAENILGNCFTGLIIASIIITILFFIFGERLLYIFGASENTIIYATDYLYIYLIGTICVMMTTGLNAFITTQGYTKYSMLTVMIGAIINIVLDPVFIFVFGMGIKGAALATIISQTVSLIWVIRFLKGQSFFSWDYHHVIYSLLPPPLTGCKNNAVCLLPTAKNS
ncbi:MAG: MATE family efflux transporter, partial [Lachnospiraceae bacterium]